MSRRSCFVYSVVFIQILLFGCRPLVITSNRVEQPIVIDGKEKDWQSVPLHHFESWDAAIGLCNDSDFLYLLLLFKNPMLIMQARFRGMILEFSGADHGETMLTLQYTGADSLHPIFESEDSFWQCLNEDQKKQMIRRRLRLKDRITVTWAGHTDYIPPDGTQGPSASRIYDDAFTGYEWKIPIRYGGPSSSLDLNADTTMDIRIRLGERPSDINSGLMQGRGGFMAGPPMGRGRGPNFIEAEMRFRLVLTR